MFSPSGGEQATFHRQSSPGYSTKNGSSGSAPGSPSQEQIPYTPGTQSSQGGQYHEAECQVNQVGGSVHYRHQRGHKQVSTFVKTTYQSRNDQHSPPVRDAASLKGVKYGPGHEKYPSWPTSAAAEAPAATRSPPTGGSHRSKSWTDYTHYPKETLVVYTRPYMKRNANLHSQQLKPVFEGTDKALSDSQRDRLCSEEKNQNINKDNISERSYLSSPPERDTSSLAQNTEEFHPVYQVKTVYQDTKMHYSKMYSKEPKKLTQAELEEYTRNYEETLQVQHQKQSSYAQSEGYHSYVSSTDSTSTPFLDRLRREADSGLSSGSGSWEIRGDRDSVVTTSSSSASSSETLKWHGSLSDISVASSSFSSTSKQLIAHSAKVKTPQRHSSESILYIEGQSVSDNGSVKSEAENEHREPPNCQQHRKLFPISTYAVPEPDDLRQPNRTTNSYSPPKMSVAERVSELERQNRYIKYQDSKRQSRIGDPSLKETQKKALLSFYERQQQKENKQSWRSEPQLASEQAPVDLVVYQQPASSSRRASSASDYADWRDQCSTIKTTEKQQNNVQFQVPNSSRFSPNSVLEGPVIVGQEISLDEWVPERPPKNSRLLRNIFPDLYNQEERLPSPDLPLPSPPTVLEDEVFNNDEPFPPPPTEITDEWKEPLERLVYDNNLINSPVNLQRPNPIKSITQSEVATVAEPVSQQMRSNRDQSRQAYALRDKVINDQGTPDVHPIPALPQIDGYKRAHSNFGEAKFARSSFRVPHESPSQGAFPHIDIRASLRHYRSNALHSKMLPQKPAMSAQKLLFRSTTVDESTSPKRPINPFLRSTSLTQAKSDVKDAGNNTLKPEPILPMSYTIPDKSKIRYSCDPVLLYSQQPSQISYSDKIENRSLQPDDKGANNKNELDRQVLNSANIIEAHVANSATPNQSKANAEKGITIQKQRAVLMTSGLSKVPPLHPKQGTINSASKAEPETSLISNRGQDTVCYAPARANRLEPAAGSYKLIQHKDELPGPPLPARPEVPVLPDLLPDTARRPFNHACDKTSPLEPSFKITHRHEPEPQKYTETQKYTEPPKYSNNENTTLLQDITPKPPEKSNPTATLNATEIDPKIDVICDTNRPEVAVVDSTEPKTILTGLRTTVGDMIVHDADAVNANERVQESVSDTEKIVSKDSSSRKSRIECETEELGALEGVKSWWEQLPAEAEWFRVRRRLLDALPCDHHLLHHSSLSEDQKSPADYIRDFFGSESSEGISGDRRDSCRPDSPPSSSKNISLEQLKSKVLASSERLVGELLVAVDEVAKDSTANDTIGNQVHSRLTPTLAVKFTSHHREVGNIAALMAALSARLARAHDDVVNCNNDAQLELLRSKQEKLREQLEEARALKTNIDMRAATLATALISCLNEDSLHLYQVFITSKPRLIIRARFLQHKLEYEQERLRNLKLSLDFSPQCPPL